MIYYNNFDIIRFAKLDSTNNYAHQLVKSKKSKDGMVILADYQTDGKGHAKNIWNSKKNSNLTFSLIIEPSFLPIQHQFSLSQIISLGISDFLHYKLASEKIMIKWPNDLLVDGQKIGGILIENMINGDQLSHSIIGIGININQTNFPDFQPQATSMRIVSDKRFHRIKALDRLLNFINIRYQQLSDQDYEAINSDYLKLLFRYQKKSDYLIDGKKQQATIVGLDEYGRLLLQKNDESVEAYDLKEIKYLY